MTHALFCFQCNTSAGRNDPLHCPQCGEPRALQALTTPPSSLFSTPPASMWHYRDLLPLKDTENIVSLGEGATRLVEAPTLGRARGLGQLLFKNEMQNPTGSFKDRQVSVGISHAKSQGMDTVAVVSSGNVACAAAAYAARAGMRAVLFMNGQAGAGKMAQAAAYGATLVRVDSPAPSVAFDLCLQACAKWGWYHLSTAGMYEAYNVEGAKTIAYELYQQTAGDLPDWIVAPVGGGGLLGGIWRGLLDLERLGLLKKMPRLCGVQASGCAPLTMAIDQDMSFLETLQHPWPDPKTVAGGIADDIIFDGHTVLPAIRRTQGRAIDVNDEEIIAGVKELARSEGLLCELTTGVVVPALRHLHEANGQRVCCVLTGSGIKDVNHPALKPELPPLVEPTLASLERALQTA